ncbi:hypothetical protein [Vibrio crassostreae]|uniref:Uncharacterized protein n=3 Tax=Vibrio crassostreae TaxID=246167 RepID=A0A4R2F473_9VIBR|nr:hypothetical protein [Vibrio crassostreae]MDH5952385.1 hypothetical protein [Vibrio crassostreae]TCN02795.1 hypothetical protein EDB35_1349 [Vibrio crassostreae]TCN80803.1 hypothetical protein EDB37_103335 [Vibrio crassostreae]TCO01493.1 hypothetical protein EDB30_10811 [Vibrio crassostreae]TCT51263.1 hypothetical protein EDB42_10637 [Vibrio crassostreae]
MPSPRKAILRLATTSKIFILLCFFVVGAFTLAIHLNNNAKTSHGSSPSKKCMPASIKALPTVLEKELRAITCSIEKATHSLDRNSNSLVTIMWPLLPVFALLTTTSVFIFTIAANTYRHLQYVTYNIETQKDQNKTSGRMRVINQNEVSEYLIKAYFFDYSGKKCNVSEIPSPKKGDTPYIELSSGKPLELTLLPHQAEAARSAPKKIDIALSTTSGKIMCIRGEDYWKPEQISQT